jgi:hypothetical protein
MKKSFDDILKFSNAGSFYVRSLNGKKTKLSYAIEKVSKQTDGYISEYRDAVQDIGIEYAAVDSDGVLLVQEDGSFKFTKEGLKNKVRDERDLLKEWKDKEFDVEPFYSTELPEDISDAMLDVLTGFVIAPSKTIENGVMDELESVKL